MLLRWGWQRSYHPQYTQALQIRLSGTGGPSLMSLWGVHHPREHPLPHLGQPLLLVRVSALSSHSGGVCREESKAPMSFCTFLMMHIPEKPVIFPKSCACQGSDAQRAPSPFQRGIQRTAEVSAGLLFLVPPSPPPPPLSPGLIFCCLLVEEEIKVILMDASPAEACLLPPVPPPASPCSVQIKGEDQAHVIFFVQNQYSAKFICPT